MYWIEISKGVFHNLDNFVWMSPDCKCGKDITGHEYSFTDNEAVIIRYEIESAIRLQDYDPSDNVVASSTIWGSGE